MRNKRSKGFLGLRLFLSHTGPVSCKTAFNAAESSAKADPPRIMICLREQGRGCMLHSWLMRTCEAAVQNNAQLSQLYLFTWVMEANLFPLWLLPRRLSWAPVKRSEGAHLSFTSWDASRSGRNVIYLLLVLMVKHIYFKSWLLCAQCFDGDDSPVLLLFITPCIAHDTVSIRRQWKVLM